MRPLVQSLKIRGFAKIKIKNYLPTKLLHKVIFSVSKNLEDNNFIVGYTSPIEKCLCVP